MHSDGIQNDLQLQRKNENNISEACIIPTVFETIWNCREKNENNVPKACILTVFLKTNWDCKDKIEKGR